MRLKNTLLLLLTSLIWGVAFVAQSVGADRVGAFTFNGVRCLIGAAALLPVIAVRRRRGGKKEDGGKRELLKGGILCGVLLALASTCQQIGVSYTSTGKAGFLTALYIVIVPLLGIFAHRRLRRLVWAGVALALFGMYLLCMASPEGFGAGDAALLACAFLFSLQILTVDRFSARVDGVKFSCLEFLVSGLVCSAGMVLWERPGMGDILAAGVPLLYAGVLSCGVGYTLQIVGQKDYDPTVASLIMSLESVFSALAGWALLGQTLSVRELAGCALVFGAVILAQLPERKARAEG